MWKRIVTLTLAVFVLLCAAQVGAQDRRGRRSTSGRVLDYLVPEAEAASCSSTWTTSYEVDFTAASNNTLTAGSEVIDGKTWTVANDSHANTFAVVNGTGLVINPKGDSNNRYDGGDRTLPIMQISVASLFSSFDPSAHRLRWEIVFATTNAFTAGAYQGWYAGFEPVGALANREYVSIGSRRDWNGMAAFSMHQASWAHSWRTADLQVANGVAVLELMPHVSVTGWVLTQGDTSWPSAVTSMDGVGSLAIRPALTTETGPMFGVPAATGSDPGTAVFLGAQGWSYGSFTLVVKKARLRYSVCQ